MKRGTPEHFKTMRLATLLSAERPCDVAEAVGILEMLCNHVAPRSAPQGNIGRLSNEEIAVACRTTRDPGVLVRALVECGWLDEDDEHRLLIHDYEEHADEAVRKMLSRNKLPFLRPHSTGSVYIAFAPARGLLKIGRTRAMVEARLAEIASQIGSAVELVASTQGDVTLERDLHRRFADVRVEGEWFQDCREIRALAEAWLYPAVRPRRAVSRRVATRKDAVDPPRAGTGAGTGTAEAPDPIPEGGAGGDVVVLSAFDRFWSAYPRKVDKADARKAWGQVQGDLAIELMLTALAWQRRSAQWQEAGGKFIPHPATWLRHRRWEDEPEPASTHAFGTAKTAGNAEAFRRFVEGGS